METLDKYLTMPFFIGLNILIIILVETVGHGQYFFNTGLIHLIAVLFVLLAFLRVAFRRNVHDPILQKFIWTAMAAMLVFALSHVIEFVSLITFHTYTDAVFANTANFYLISLLLIIIGAEAFLRVYHSRSGWLIWVSWIAIALLTIFTALILGKKYDIDLGPDHNTAYIYAVVVLVVTVIGLIRAWEIRKHVPLIRNFVNYLFASIILIALAILPNVFYEFIGNSFKIADYQSVYLSHFSFYIALSLLFLAFGKLQHLGGMLDEVDQFKTQN